MAGKSKKTSSSAEPKPVVIDTSLKNDRCVEIRGSVNLTASTAYLIQRGLLLQALAKNGNTSTIKLYLGPAYSNKYRMQDQAALADTMRLVGLPVDVVIKSGAGPDVLKAFLSATGKRYMYAGATLHMGVITSNAPYGKNKANQVRRQLFNDYKTDLRTLVMMKTGETDAVKVFDDLLSAKAYSSLEALYYGKYGLIDGILMGRDEVITRADLNAFFKRKKWNAEQIAAFNKNYINVYQVPTRPLKKFSPQSLSEGTHSFYKSLKKQPTAQDKAKDSKDKGKDDATKKDDDKPKVPTFYFGEKKLDDLPMVIKATKDKPVTRVMVENLPASACGILDDDVIFFNDGFRDETAEQIAEALLALDHKKIAQKNTSHIKIIENSPGGSVWSGQELRSLIRSLATPVDVIVNGMGASCGSWLLCSATGNRYATPNARIMFHEAANELRDQTPADHYNEMHDSLDQATMNYIAIVAEATGRLFEDVLKDFDNDVWLNPVECLFYGSRGMIDAILVGHNTVITRKDVEAYLIQKLGSASAVKKYVTRKIEEKRDPRLGMEWRPEKHPSDDPFDNPLETIAQVTAQSAKSLGQLKSLKGSVPMVQPERTIDFFNVVFDEDKKK